MAGLGGLGGYRMAWVEIPDRDIPEFLGYSQTRRPTMSPKHAAVFLRIETQLLGPAEPMDRVPRPSRGRSAREWVLRKGEDRHP